MRVAYQAMAVAMSAIALAACARDALVEGRTGVTSGKWAIERAIDRVTQAPVPSAFVLTRTVANSRILFPPPASLQLTCFKNKPIVRVEFQFKIGSTRNAQLGYAFDQIAGREPPVRFVDGFRVVIIEDDVEVARFAEGLRNATKVYIRIRALNAGRTSAEFETTGAPQAIAEAYQSCPLIKLRPGAAAPPNRVVAAAKRGAQAPAAATAEDDDDDENSDNSQTRTSILTGAETAPTEEEAALNQIRGWLSR